LSVRFRELTIRKQSSSMNEFTKLGERMPGMLKALALGIPAGYLFHRLHAPIPWMIGPMVAVATLNLLGVQMHSPPYARQMGQVILGSAVSLYFTPTVVRALAANLPAIVAATVGLLSRWARRAHLEPGLGSGRQVHFLRFRARWCYGDGRIGGSLRRSDRARCGRA
jgi:hypothetical protein